MVNSEFSGSNLITQLNKDIEKINKPELSDEKKALLLSELLTDQYLKAEAIKLLEKIVPKSQNPALWVNLGRLYQSVGSNDLAEKIYTRAIELATTAQEPVERILAKAGLAKVLISQGNTKDAESLLDEVRIEVNALKAEDQRNASSTCNPICTEEDHHCGVCCRDGKVGKCIRIDGTNMIVCRTDLC